MAAETNPLEQESQIQEKTITSQTEDLKKKVDEVDHDERPPLNGNGNHTESNGNHNNSDNEEEDMVQPSGDAGVVIDDDEKPSSMETNEAECDVPTEIEQNEAASENNEAESGEPNQDGADSGIDEEQSAEADSGTTTDGAEIQEADSGSTKEVTAEEESTEAVTSTDSTAEDKPKTDDVKVDDEKTTKDAALGSTVAKHYNEIAPITKESRKSSRIYHLRNFNNWVKSVIISEYLEKVKRRKRVSDDINVLDIACGKGGDILKWQKGKIDHVIMVDIAAKSVDECKERYNKLKKDQRNNRYSNDRLFTSEFFVADCTKERLNGMFRNKGIKLDMASCQFAFHYSFESYEQADLMLKNCCENLRVGGYFIGTTPDAQKLVKHIKDCKADSFGNSVFNIKPENKESFPLFGSKYMFYLEGVVDCPEFIVYLPLLEKMAAKYNMKLVWKKNFHEIFKEYERQHGSLLSRMSALEQYPASEGRQLTGGSESQYKSAKDYVDKKGGDRRVGTLSADEWEVAGLYIAFAFEKIDPSKAERKRDERREDRRDDRKDARRDDRKRTRDDDRGRSSDRRGEDRHDRRKSSDASNSKRSKKEAEEEYEIKDEIYEDDDNKTESKSSKSSSSSHRRSSRDERSESKSRKSESEKSPSKKTEEKKEAEAKDEVTETSNTEASSTEVDSTVADSTEASTEVHSTEGPEEVNSTEASTEVDSTEASTEVHSTEASTEVDSTEVESIEADSTETTATSTNEQDIEMGDEDREDDDSNESSTVTTTCSIGEEDVAEAVEEEQAIEGANE